MNKVEGLQKKDSIPKLYLYFLELMRNLGLLDMTLHIRKNVIYHENVIIQRK